MVKYLFMCLLILFSAILPGRETHDIDDDRKAHLTKKDWIRVGHKFLQCHSEKVETEETCYRSAKQAVMLRLFENMELTWDDGLMKFSEDEINVISPLFNPYWASILPENMYQENTTVQFTYPIYKDTTPTNNLRPNMMLLLIEKEVNGDYQHKEVTYSTKAIILFKVAKIKEYLLLALQMMV